MQTSFKPTRQNQSAYALLIVMSFLAAALLVFASVMYWISSNSRVTAMNNQFNLSEAAAEAATEKVLSQMNYDYVAQSFSNSGAYYSTFIPSATEQALWPIQYIYSDTNNQLNQISVNMGSWTTNTVPLNSQYAGLYGLEKNCTITATATPTNVSYPVPATICESIQFASIPLFQFAIFYNMNLEINAAATLTIAGPVWSNGGIWSGANITFSTYVSAVGIATNCLNDPFCPGYSATSTSTYSLAGQPTSGNDRITMPIGTNNDPATVEALVNLPPAAYAMNTAAAFTTNGLVYFANGADLYLTNFSNGTNWGSLTPRGTNMILYYQDATQTGNNLPAYWDNVLPYQTQMPYDFFIMTNKIAKSTFITNWVSASTTTNLNNVTNIIYAGYSFVTNVLFYDWREGWNSGSGVNSGPKGKAVQAVQIDVGKFNAWLFGTNMDGTTNVNGGQYCNAQCTLSSHKTHPIDSIYVYNAVPLTGTTLPAVRVIDGGMLPLQCGSWGFTVATAMPLYVFGDYNVSNNFVHTSIDQNVTTYTWPAALMCDAITILSDSWKDSVITRKPNASATTTVNAACLAGIVQSTNTTYSGGVENFFRLLETWGTFYWNGSIVAMFPSQYATNSWQQTGDYYIAAARHWAFDTNFTSLSKLPPLTPIVVNNVTP